MSDVTGDPPAARRPVGAGPARAISRGLMRRCGRCGAGDLFHRWFQMRPCCPGCGYRFEREEGFFLGAYVMNYAAAAIVVAIDLVVVIAAEARSDTVNVIPILAAGALAALLVPVIFYPFSRTTWAAIDLVMRPLELWEVAEADLLLAQSHRRVERSHGAGDRDP